MLIAAKDLLAVFLLIGAAVASGQAPVSKSVPAPRHGVAMAYDPARQQVVMFGGVNHLLKPSQEFYSDTWTWNGRRWALLGVNGPTARVWPSMAFDPRSRRPLLFGGRDKTRCLGDTWQWDGKRWSELKLGTSPPPRWHFAMATDERNGTVVLFGGVDTDTNPSTVYGDTWVWDGASWHRAAESGPPPRFGHAMA